MHRRWRKLLTTRLAPGSCMASLKSSFPTTLCSCTARSSLYGPSGAVGLNNWRDPIRLKQSKYWGGESFVKACFDSSSSTNRPHMTTRASVLSCGGIALSIFPNCEHSTVSCWLLLATLPALQTHIAPTAPTQPCQHHHTAGATYKCIIRRWA